jgi:hypothetical protein
MLSFVKNFNNININNIKWKWKFVNIAENFEVNSYKLANISVWKKVILFRRNDVVW